MTKQEKGWVIVNFKNPKNQVILYRFFESKKRDCITAFVNEWSPYCSWDDISKKYKYKAVKATITIKIEE